MGKWRGKILSEIGTFERGRGLQKSDFVESGIPCIHYGQIFTYYGGFTDSTISFVSAETAKNCTTIYPGDAILTITSENVQDLCKSTVWLGKENIITGEHSGIFRHNQNPKFIGYYFESQFFQKQKAKYAKGTKVIEINPEDILNKIKIILPDLETQGKIATILEKWDTAIENLKQQIRKEEKIFNGLVEKLLKASSSYSQKYSFKELFDFKNGYTPSKNNKVFWKNGTLPWFRMEDIRKNGRILNDSIQHVTSDAVKVKLFSKDSIIMSTTATIGEYAWITADSLANQQFTFLTRKVNCLDKVDIEWFYYYCEILSRWCKRNVNQGGLTAVDMKAFMDYEICLPPINEQKNIAEILRTQEKSISLLRQKLANYESQRKYLLNRLLSGKEDI